MQDVLDKMEDMTVDAIEQWIYDNMHVNKELADDFNDMIAKLSYREEEDGEDTEEDFEWGVRYFFLKLNGFDDEDAVQYAESCY